MTTVATTKKAPVWTRATIQLSRARRHDPRYLLHQAVCDIWDGEPRPVWRLVQLQRETAVVVILSETMPRGGPRGRWGRVAGVEVGPVRTPAEGERLVFAGSIVATAEVDDVRRALLDAYPDEPAGELYADYIQRRLGAAATVRAAEVYRVQGHTFRRRGHRSAAIQYAVADVGGTLKVHDPGALVDAMCNGIGRGKAFGFGLLTLSGEGWTWWR